ncbi:hypothetical protein ZA02_00995 [Campylobacter lanienae]|uniref:hypothetical protein n=1 Tax=Campylobacter lanienae TaxID=75658 RepID=UPI0011ADDEB9|nr:hypothetical protein [Campylobacter lanienae]TWO17646.1 hypothetical protein ZA02_00995 [Campylobacter lanienae]
MIGLNTTIVANSTTPPTTSKKSKINNPKFLLSSITIGVLYSASFSVDYCVKVGDTCTIRGQTINGNIDAPWHSGTADMTGKSVIIENTTINATGAIINGASVRNQKVDNNTFIISDGSVLNVYIM